MTVKYCKKCGWKLDYQPRSFQEQIREIMGKQNKRGYWRCPNCDVIKNTKNEKRTLNDKKRNKKLKI